MQEGADDLLFVQPALGRERQHVDAAEMPVLAVADQRLDRGEHLGIGRFAERTEQRVLIVHGNGT